MNNARKHSYSKPNLVIQIENFQKKIFDFNEKHNKNQVAIKPLRSAKNIHEIKRFNFQDKHVQTINHSQKLKKLHQLQQQKQSLIESLQILKESAVSALAQKQDELQQLRRNDSLNNQQRLEFYQLQLNNSQRLREQLQEECHRLYRQMKSQKQKYIIQLQQKQTYIQELHNQILFIRRQLQILQHNDVVKNKKIKILQQENNKLSSQLELVNMDNSMKQKYKDVCQNGESEQPFPMHSHHYQSQNLNRSFSAIVDRNILSMLETQHFFQSEEDKTFMSEKLQEINYTHSQELLDIKVQYQKQISALRQIYERQLKLPTEESSHEYSLKRKRSKSKSQSSSMKSIHYPTFENKKQPSQQGLNLNLKGMNTIIQNVQQFLQTQRYRINNLQTQLKMHNLSQCPSVQRLITQQDNQSQFTSKYFQPAAFKFQKKNKSSAQLHTNNQTDHTNNQTKTILKTKRQKQQALQQNLVTQLQQKEQVEKNGLWEKTYLFVSGIVSGVAISSIAGYFFKNKI